MPGTYLSISNTIKQSFNLKTYLIMHTELENLKLELMTSFPKHFGCRGSSVPQLNNDPFTSSQISYNSVKINTKGKVHL